MHLFPWIWTNIPLIQLDLLHNLNETILIRDDFNLHVVKFPYICSIIPTAPADRVYVCELKRCSLSSGSPSWIFVILYRFCVTNEHWYAWFVLIAVNFICLCAWLITMCDIWPVVDVSCIMKSLVEKHLIYHLEPVCPTPVLMALMLLKHQVSNENHGFPFVLSLFDLCPSVCWLWLHRCCLPAFLILIGSQNVIVFSTYFIFCSDLNYNQITSIQAGAFNNLTSLTYL